MSLYHHQLYCILACMLRRLQVCHHIHDLLQIGLLGGHRGLSLSHLGLRLRQLLTFWAHLGHQNEPNDDSFDTF